MGMRIKRLVIVVGVLGLLAACGGDGTNPNANPTSPGATNGSPSPDGTGTGGPITSGTNNPSTKPPTSSANSPRPSGTATGSGKTASLDKTCVRRGANDDRQGLTLRTTPNGPYGYATVYSDGSSIIDPTPHPEYDPDGNGPIGGQGGGFADSAGDARQQWVVPPTAPLGEATVRVNLGGTVIDLKFTVAARTGTCP
jgi:hypothetical protein